MTQSGRVIAVTGGGSGIGAATAQRFAEDGAASVLLGYRESGEDASAVAEEIKATGSRVHIVRVDVSDDHGVRAFAAECEARFGRCDVVVNAAGATRWIPMSDLEAVTEQDWTRLLDVNLVGAFRIARAFHGLLRASSGVIVNVGSTAGHRGAGSSIPYSASKAALLQLTRSLAVAMAPEVRVVSVSPGTVDTRWHRNRMSEEEHERYLAEIAGSTPTASVATPADVAAAIVGIAASPAVTGVDLLVDGGRHILY